jgi:radical SAM family uncharacterized protein/radical SAM-linked protein
MDLRFLRGVMKPTRYTGGEVNEVVKAEAPGLLHVALAFPDSYDIGMSTMGLKILYKVLNDREDIWAERVFMPMPDMVKELEARSLPLYGLESKRPLSAFDVVGFTLQFELTYTNILHMLRLGRIPVRAADRGPDDPVVIAGGPCAVNPEPLAPFFDAVFIGDGEEGALDLCEVVRATRGRPRAEVWRALARVEGTYVPALYLSEQDPETGMEVVTGPSEEGAPFPVKRRILRDMRRFPFPTGLIVPHHEVVHDRYTIEIARGCAVGCRFCQAGYIYRPVREREPADIKASVEEGLRRTGFNEVTLLSLNAGEYEGVEDLVRQLASAGASQNVGVSMPSLRVSSLTKELAQSLSAGRKSGFTLAPEAGTQRLRDVINKQATEEDLQRAASAVFSSGWNLVKLYFMLGLPTETEEDVEGIARLAKLVVRAGREANCKNPQVNLSASCFVPKPFTPFQWRPMESPDSLRGKQERLRSALKRPVTFRWHDVEASLVEGVFSLGDRRLAAVLERAAELGCAFDGWGEHFNGTLWRQAFADAGIPAEDYLFRERDRRERLPWDHIDLGLLKSFLWREWEKASEGATTETCGPESCHACGFFARECMDGGFSRSPVEPRAIPAMPPAVAGATHRYRLRFRKQGLARFIGHLDLMEMLVRAMRRCGVILAYTRGYHPIPKVEFPPPLPLGVEGLEEWMEFHAPPLDREAVVERLASALPAGVTPEQIFLVPSLAPGLSALSVQVYGVDASDLDARELGDLRARTEAFDLAPEWVVQREAKGKSKALDLKTRVVDISWEGALLRVKMVQGGLMDLVESLCPAPARDRLRLSRLTLEFAE